MLALILSTAVLGVDGGSQRLDVDRLLEASFLGQLKAPREVRRARADELRAQAAGAQGKEKEALVRVLRLVETDLSPPRALSEQQALLRELAVLAKGSFDHELSVGRGLDSLSSVAERAGVDPGPARAEAVAFARDLGGRWPHQARAHALLASALYAAGEGPGPVLGELKRCVELGDVPHCRTRHAELLAQFEAPRCPGRALKAGFAVVGASAREGKGAVAFLDHRYLVEASPMLAAADVVEVTAGAPGELKLKLTAAASRRLAVETRRLAALTAGAVLLRLDARPLAAASVLEPVGSGLLVTRCDGESVRALEAVCNEVVHPKVAPELRLP